MSANELPVTVAVRRPDGQVEHVRVGTAVRQGDGFALTLGELRIGAAAASMPAPRAPARQAKAETAGVSGPLPTQFPNYGRSKGAPIAGASQSDLEYYANGARRSLADPSKARWQDKERALLAAIEAELARQGGGAGGPPDDDVPPPTDADYQPEPEE